MLFQSLGESVAYHSDEVGSILYVCPAATNSLGIIHPWRYFTFWVFFRRIRWRRLLHKIFLTPWHQYCSDWIYTNTLLRVCNISTRTFIPCQRGYLYSQRILTIDKVFNSVIGDNSDSSCQVGDFIDQWGYGSSADSDYDPYWRLRQGEFAHFKFSPDGGLTPSGRQALGPYLPSWIAIEREIQPLQRDLGAGFYSVSKNDESDPVESGSDLDVQSGDCADQESVSSEEVFPFGRDGRALLQWVAVSSTYT